MNVPLNVGHLVFALTPDIVLLVGSLIVLLWSAWAREEIPQMRALAWASVAVCVLTAAAVIWMWTTQPAVTHAGLPVAVDGFRWGTALLVLLSSIIAIILTRDYMEREGMLISESYPLLLFATSGMLLLVAARDLLTMFLAIELMSVCVYALAGLNRRSPRSAEAALKYFLLGSFSTGILLYGIALTYGATASIEFAAIGQSVTAGQTAGMSPVLLLGIALLLVGFAFKVGAVPFHMWAPDVYEGAPTPYTAFMAAGVKVAAFAAFMRLWLEGFQTAGIVWYVPLAAIAVLTMVGGNVIALAQKNVKRMLAYSSIAHTGYVLVAIAAGTQLGATAFVFYLLAYSLATMGAFAVVGVVAGTGDRGSDLTDFHGLWTVRPGLTLAMAVFMLALLGFPIFGGMGFFAKWYVLDAALSAAGRPLVMLAVVLVLASVVSAGYYLSVVMAMFMRPRAEGAALLAPTPPLTNAVVALSAILILVLGVWPQPVLRAARDSVPIQAQRTPAPVTPVAATDAR